MPPVFVAAALVLLAALAPMIAPYAPDAIDLAGTARTTVGGTLVRHRRPRARPAGAGALRREGVAGDRRPGRRADRGVRRRRRRHRRMDGTMDRRAAHARGRRHPRGAQAAAADDRVSHPPAFRAAAHPARGSRQLDGNRPRRARRGALAGDSRVCRGRARHGSRRRCVDVASRPSQCAPHARRGHHARRRTVHPARVGAVILRRRCAAAYRELGEHAVPGAGRRWPPSHGWPCFPGRPSCSPSSP